jgi:hypothetical protein
MEPRYTPRLWQLGAALALALSGAVVVWMIAHPQVEDDYRHYYIERSWSCFPRLVTFYYPLGAPVSFVAGRNGYDRDSIRWCGFMPMKADGIKSFGDYGILKLRLAPPGEDLLLTFSSWANTNAGKPAREVTVRANGTEIGSVTFKDARRVNGQMVIPRDVAASGDGFLEIRFEVPRIAPPGTNSEPVTLQLRLEAVRVVPLSMAPPPATTPVAAPIPAH